MIVLASFVQYSNPELDRWFNENKNKAEWKLDVKKLNNQDMVIVANNIKQNIEVGKVLVYEFEIQFRYYHLANLSAVCTIEFIESRKEH